MTDIAAPTQGEPITERDIKTVTEVEGLKYEVVFNKAKLKVGEATMANSKSPRPTAEIFTQLEPINGHLRAPCGLWRRLANPSSTFTRWAQSRSQMPMRRGQSGVPH